MARIFATPVRTYRVGMHLLLVVALFGACFATLGYLVWQKRHDPTLLLIVAVAFSLLFLLLSVLRIEFTRTGFKYRNLGGSTSVQFDEVRSARFEVLRESKSPQGVATFWLDLRNGQSLKINLRTFSIEAAAILFSSLEAKGIAIEVPDQWAARRMAKQVRAAQASFRG